jgi:hypothetical protein
VSAGAGWRVRFDGWEDKVYKLAEVNKWVEMATDIGYDDDDDAGESAGAIGDDGNCDGRDPLQTFVCEICSEENVRSEQWFAMSPCQHGMCTTCIARLAALGAAMFHCPLCKAKIENYTGPVAKHNPRWVMDPALLMEDDTEDTTVCYGAVLHIHCMLDTLMMMCTAAPQFVASPDFCLFARATAAKMQLTTSKFLRKNIPELH